MDSSKLIDIIQDGNIVIPIYVIKKMKDLKLEFSELVLLMYLQKFGNKFLFDPGKFSNDFNITLEEIMEMIDTLSDKGFIQVDVKENDKGIMEEYVLLDGFYQRLKGVMIQDVQKEEKKKDDEDSIYTYLEQKFGRTLGSIDYEIIHAWLENNYDEELIKKAVDEAVLNGVSTLKYIDRILYEWSKKGIENVSDFEKKKGKKQDHSKEKLEEDIDLGIMDWDWFDEEE